MYDFQHIEHIEHIVGSPLTASRIDTKPLFGRVSTLAMLWTCVKTKEGDSITENEVASG